VLTDPIDVPLWLVVVGGLLAAWTISDRFVRPSLSWILRRWVQRVLEETDTRLPIRLQPFKLTRRQTLIDRLMFDRKVIAAAEVHAERHGLRRSQVMSQVESYVREIVPAFNAYFYFRLGYSLARRLAQTLYRVRIGASDELGLATIGSDATVIFIMNHRSNMDYILVAYLAAEKAVLSYAVGEWARIWPIEGLIRAMGAYFVRRRSRNDLYRRVLERYVQVATSEGVTQAVFPEGRLSRDGRLQPPKLGLIDYMLRDFDPGGSKDLVFVPVALNYDRVLEDRTLLLDLDPAAQRKKGIAALATGVRFGCRNLWLMLRAKWHRFGYACVNFGTPISAKTYLGERGLDLRQLERSKRFEMVQEFGERLMAEVAGLVPVLPVALVATVLIRDPGRRFSDLELKAEVQSLIDDLESRGAPVYVPRRDREYAIMVGLRMLTLRRVVAKSPDGLLTSQPHELELLRYYANSIGHLTGR
jgi:glycerol-3-phosphate O-acyltransferase